MTILELTGQTESAGQIQTEINKLKKLLEQRRQIWNKLPTEKKRAWIVSGKDPIMTLAWNVFKYLKNDFFQEENTNG